MNDDDPDGADRFTAEYVNDPAWAEPLRMCAEALAERTDDDEADELAAILHDATEAAMRSVIGKRDIDSVLSQDRKAISKEAQQVLEGMLNSYVTEVGHAAAFAVERINLEKPQAPEAVREAFADVVSAGQDEKRSTLQAAGDSQNHPCRAGRL